MTFHRGDILWIRCDPSVGVEPKKTRTCVVVSTDRANEDPRWLAVTVVPTRKFVAQEAWRPYFVDLRAPRSTLSDARFANCSQLMTCDRSRIAKAAGRVSFDAIVDIDKALKIHLALDEDLPDVHERQAEYRRRATAVPSPPAVRSRRPRRVGIRKS